MAAPALQKTWEFKVNQDLNTLGNWITDRQRLLRAIKDSLIDGVSFTTPWTVRGSSNSTAAGMDAVDRWLLNTDLVWSSGAVATGNILTVAGGLLNDTETFTINDGINTATVFEFDSGGGVTPPNVAVPFTVGDTATQIRDAMIAAINGVGAGLLVSAAVGDVAKVNLTNGVGGTQGNQLITDTVAAGGFVPTGMLGGTDTAHSWIVLRQAALGADVELLISCCTGNQGNDLRYLIVQLAVSGVGFAGGSTTTDPTAPNTITTLLQPTFADPIKAGLGYWLRGNDNTTFDCALHAMLSDDGECTRVGVFVGGLPMLWLIVDKVNNPATGLTIPIFGCWIADYTLSEVRTSDSPLWLDVMATSTPVYAETYPWRAGSMRHGGADFNVTFTTERTGSIALPTEGAVPERACKINALDSSKLALTAMGLYSKVSGKSGRHGAVYDLWFGDADAPVGRGYPSDVAPDFVHWRHVVVPWNGAAMLTG